MTIIITQWQHFRWWKSWGRSWGLGWCLTLFMPKISRFVSLRPHVFTISPTDMKLLNHEHRVNITWHIATKIEKGTKMRDYNDCFFISGQHHLVSRTDFEVSWFRISNRQCLLLRCWFSLINMADRLHSFSNLLYINMFHFCCDIQQAIFCDHIKRNFSIHSLWVKAHWKWSLEIPQLCLSFYLTPNISD